MPRLPSLLLACALSSTVTAASAQTEVDKATQAVSANVIRAHIEFLASDALEGRGPGTRGGDLAARYIATQFIRLGLQPAGDDSTYFFKVPLISFTPAPTLALSGNALAYPADFVLNPMRWDSVVTVDAPLVFAGYGIVAPEYEWNDYAGVDVKGKIVAVLVNDPGLYDPAIFKGKVLTYYARWTYKFEEAARQGAAGVLLIHTEESATYPWGTVEGSATGKQVRLETAPTSLQVTGWIQHDAMARAFAAAGDNLDQASARAGKRGFVAYELPVRVAASVRSTFVRTATYNVLGRLPGTGGPLAQEVVVIGAHYDHLGIAKPVDGDSIYNGARDNAAGVGEMLAIAEAMSRGDLKGKRSILFTAFGGEEAGLLGSQALIDRPFMPLRNVAAMLNFDGANLFGRTRDVSANGSDQSSLLGALQAAARLEGLQVSDDSAGMYRGTFFRSDNFPFARAGIPSLSFEPGSTFAGRPPDYGAKAQADYTAKRYHRPQDEFGAWYNLDGAVQETRVGLRTAIYAADASAQPTWDVDSEFRAAGEARMKAPKSKQ
ncbi:MAG TPA: M28 family peptidase [Gemmatimonadales bacterium]|nr:M28 family peptidase [Gemmatimonadales bacterium]